MPGRARPWYENLPPSPILPTPKILLRLERIFFADFFALFASSRLCRAALSPRRRKGREEDAKSRSGVQALACAKQHSLKAVLQNAMMN